MTPLVRDQPLFTDFIADAATFALADGATFVSSVTPETRSHHVDHLRKRCSGAGFVDVVSATESGFEWVRGGDKGTVRLRSSQDLESFWTDVVSVRETYLDMTGFSHPVWASLVDAALRRGIPLKVVYVEPLKYRRNSVAT